MVLCLTVLLLTGCSEGLQEISGQAENPAAQESGDIRAEINAPVELNYTVENPLIWKEINEDQGQEFVYRYIKVSGLADKEIEKAVNDRIKAVYDELRVQDIPPYRGIKTRIPADSILQNESVFVNVTGNFNNILSVMFSKYANYQDPSSREFEKDPAYYDGSRFFSETETLNLDLNTGEEIELTDLFCDNVDSMKLINDYMAGFLSKNYAEDEGYYMGTFGELKLVESFKGLEEDQKFAVYPYGITFVFDYNTPQFETGGSSVCPMVFYSNFGDNIAVASRFFDERQNIYNSQEPLVKTFVAKEADNDIAGNENMLKGGVNIFRSWNYSSKIPEAIKSKLEQMRVIDREKVDRIQQIYSRMTESEKEQKGFGAYETMVSGNVVGDYINISGSRNLYMYDYYEQELDYHCYDSRTLEELRLADIFRDDFDFKPVVLEAMKKTIDNYDGTYDFSGKSEGRYSAQQYEDAFDGIKGFNLASDAVIIPVLHPEKGNQTYGLTVYIPYRELGCDNLNIFD